MTLRVRQEHVRQLTINTKTSQNIQESFQPSDLQEEEVTQPLRVLITRTRVLNPTPMPVVNWFQGTHTVHYQLQAYNESVCTCMRTSIYTHSSITQDTDRSIHA